MMVACSHNINTSGKSSPEERIAAVYPVLCPLIGPGMSKSAFIDAMMLDLGTNSCSSAKEDPELFLRGIEATTAAWQRYSEKLTLTPEQKMIYCFIAIDPHFTEADLNRYRDEMKLKDSECVTTNDLATLRSLLDEEGAKRGMKWDLQKKFIWNTAANNRLQSTSH